VPLEDQRNPGTPFAFDISMGVRKADTELKTRLEEALDRRQNEIRAILESFGVPLFPLTAAADAAGTREGAGRSKEGRP
jgi:mxaJ protein